MDMKATWGGLRVRVLVLVSMAAVSAGGYSSPLINVPFFALS